MSNNNLKKEFVKCKSLIGAEMWSRLTEKLVALPPLTSYSIGDDSLLAYARNISDAAVRQVIGCGVCPNTTYTDGATLLMDYTSLGNSEMVRFLIDAGADVDQTTPRGESALSFACAKDRLQCAKILHFQGANTEFSIGPNKTTLLDIAHQFASSEFVEWLKSEQK